MIVGQVPAVNNPPLRPVFNDRRDQRFKDGQSFVFERNFPAYSISSGDRAFDQPMNLVFERMFVSRFGNDPEGYPVELTIKAFHHIERPHDLSAVPIAGLLVAGADEEYRGVLTVEAAVLDRAGKYAFHKQYDVMVREMKAINEVRPETSLAMYRKAFDRFADEFAADVERIRF